MMSRSKLAIALALGFVMQTGHSFTSMPRSADMGSHTLAFRVALKRVARPGVDAKRPLHPTGTLPSSVRGRSSGVEHNLAKFGSRVRSPSPAPGLPIKIQARPAAGMGSRVFSRTLSFSRQVPVRETIL